MYLGPCCALMLVDIPLSRRWKIIRASCCQIINDTLKAPIRIIIGSLGETRDYSVFSALIMSLFKF